MSNAADIAIYSEVGWHILTGQHAPNLDAMRGVRARTGALPCVTIGDRGSVWLIDDAIRHVPAISVPIRDTTGAGDVFHGAFAAAYAARRDVLKAAEFATAAAALKCQLGGGWIGMPERRAVEELMKEKTR
jgi:sulfofructose kinase